MQKDLLINFKAPDWIKISEEDYQKLGIFNEDDLICLGAYLYKYDKGEFVYIYNYGDDYNEFLDEYLGFLYDNKMDKYIPSSVRETLARNTEMSSIYLENIKINEKNCLVNIFKVTSDTSISYNVQVFFHFKKELLAFNAATQFIDTKDPFKSFERSSSQSFKLLKDIITFLN